MTRVSSSPFLFLSPVGENIARKGKEKRWTNQFWLTRIYFVPFFWEKQPEEKVGNRMSTPFFPFRRNPSFTPVFRPGKTFSIRVNAPSSLVPSGERRRRGCWSRVFFYGKRRKKAIKQEYAKNFVSLLDEDISFPPEEYHTQKSLKNVGFRFFFSNTHRHPYSSLPHGVAGFGECVKNTPARVFCDLRISLVRWPDRTHPIVKKSRNHGSHHWGVHPAWGVGPALRPWR